MLRTIVISGLLAIIFPFFAIADGAKPGVVHKRKQIRTLPGEEVRTTSGKKMRVWDTSGPVSAGPPPEPFENDKQLKLDDINVIVGTPRRVLPQDDNGSRRDSFDRSK